MERARLHGVGAGQRQRQVEDRRVRRLELVVVEGDDLTVGTVNRQRGVHGVLDEGDRRRHRLEAHQLPCLPRRCSNWAGSPYTASPVLGSMIGLPPESVTGLVPPM